MKLFAILFYNIALHPQLLKAIYRHTPNAKTKYAHISNDMLRDASDFEVKLWRDDDTRTYMIMGNAMLSLNNLQPRIPVNVHHVHTNDDQYFNNQVVEQNMQVAFTGYSGHPIELSSHAPLIMTSKKEARELIPQSIQKAVFKKK